MEKKTIKDLKRGEYFTLSSIEEPRETIIERTIDQTIY